MQSTAYLLIDVNVVQELNKMDEILADKGPSISLNTNMEVSPSTNIEDTQRVPSDTEESSFNNNNNEETVTDNRQFSLLTGTQIIHTYVTQICPKKTCYLVYKILII